mmetsp:Transcript_17588/g.71141  ORF Transcript_17588/g.71141 Transcript_17588/m.71141 type:complete len:114 (-) Transcript_17588:2002-2343(-)
MRGQSAARAMRMYCRSAATRSVKTKLRSAASRDLARASSMRALVMMRAAKKPGAESSCFFNDNNLPHCIAGGNVTVDQDGSSTVPASRGLGIVLDGCGDGEDDESVTSSRHPS